MRLVQRVGPAVVLTLAIAACGGGTSTTTKGPGNVSERPSRAANGELMTTPTIRRSS